MNEWKEIKIETLYYEEAPYDGHPFLACMCGWVGLAIYSIHYDYPTDGPPKKYGFFYMIVDPEDEVSRIRVDRTPFPITHWMPLPEPPR